MSRSAGKLIIGESPQVKALLDMIAKVAPSKTSILVIGESGTGKELVARLIHESSPLKGKPFIPVNCGAIPENLIESELFGHKRGSFTGAVVDKMGLFEAATGGTLFLDEIGELPLSMQVKLLRALQDRTIRKVGGTEDVKIDVRIIAATNRDLEAAVAKGTFREDLYYRLNVILIKTPPLRDRKGDVRILAHEFMNRFAAQQKREMKGFEPEALSALENYSWPGNIRELENALQRSVALAPSDVIGLSVLPSSIIDSVRPKRDAQLPPTGGALAETPLAPPSGNGATLSLPAPDFSKGTLDLDRILGEVEKTYLLSALQHTKGVKKTAADLLGITFRSIRYRLKKLGIESGGDMDAED